MRNQRSAWAADREEFEDAKFVTRQMYNDLYGRDGKTRLGVRPQNGGPKLVWRHILYRNALGNAKSKRNCSLLAEK